MTTPEQIAVCVTAVALLALAVWALSSRAEWKRKAVDRANRIVCLRATIAAGTAVDRGVELAHLVLAAADTECEPCNNTGHISWEEPNRAGGIDVKGMDCPHCSTEHVEADTAGAMPRVAPNERWRG